jgi:HAD superfamily phosphoserine phosphatase-like hydrolase
VAAFPGLVLDVDSTLTSIEGIEWLAQRRGAAVAREIAEMTGRAMSGAVPLDDVYAARLAIVRPSRADVEALAAAYVQAMLPDAREIVRGLGHRGIEVTIVSGGIRQAVAPLAAQLGVDAERVHAVTIAFSTDGQYEGFDNASPLTRRGGKPTLVRALNLARPLLALGDGSTDAELKTCTLGGGPAVDAFAAFVGVATRPAVVAVADYIVDRFVDLPSVVLGEAFV